MLISALSIYPEDAALTDPGPGFMCLGFLKFPPLRVFVKNNKKEQRDNTRSS